MRNRLCDAAQWVGAVGWGVERNADCGDIFAAPKKSPCKWKHGLRPHGLIRQVSHMDQFPIALNADAINRNRARRNRLVFLMRLEMSFRHSFRLAYWPGSQQGLGTSARRSEPPKNSVSLSHAHDAHTFLQGLTGKKGAVPLHYLITLNSDCFSGYNESSPTMTCKLGSITPLRMWIYMNSDTNLGLLPIFSSSCTMLRSYVRVFGYGYSEF